MAAEREMARMIVEDFRRSNWKSNPLEKTLAMVIPSPASAVELLRFSLDELPHGGTFLDAAICLMPFDTFPAVVALALKKLRSDRDNKVAASIIHYASLQSVRSLHPHLTDIFELAPNAKTYYVAWPWRESGKAHFDYLRRIVDNDSNADRRKRALSAMFETREPDVMEYALSKLDIVGLGGRKNDYLRLVGYEKTPSGFLKLHSDEPHHIFFPTGYLLEDDSPVVAWRNTLRRHHPTWVLDDSRDAFKFAFGGESAGECLCCGGELHHFITLDPIPKTLGIVAVKRMEVASCLSCLGMTAEVMFYKHDAGGHPRQVAYEGEKQTPEFPGAVLKPTEIHASAISSRWKWQCDAASNGRESLHRIGGHPAWIQGADYPLCPECGDRMRFFLQLGSDLPTVGGGEHMWGDGGICYSFWCDRCGISGLTWQCY